MNQMSDHSYHNDVIRPPSDDRDTDIGSKLPKPTTRRRTRVHWIVGSLALLVVGIVAFTSVTSQSQLHSLDHTQMVYQTSVYVLGMGSTNARRARILDTLRNLQARLDGDI